jgi:hypothetical protein
MNSNSERVLRLIRERIQHNHYAKNTEETWLPLHLPTSPDQSVIDHLRKVWPLAEMLECYDRQFVQKAYIVLLKRDPDVAGLTGRLEAIQQGKMTRIEVLFRLRYGSEGNIHKVRISGLVKAYIIERLCAIPVLGVIPRTLRSIVYLPRLQRDMQDIKALLAMQKNDSDDRLQSVVEYQNAEFKKMSRTLHKKKTQ